MKFSEIVQNKQSFHSISLLNHCVQVCPTDTALFCEQVISEQCTLKSLGRISLENQIRVLSLVPEILQAHSMQMVTGSFRGNPGKMIVMDQMLRV